MTVSAPGKLVILGDYAVLEGAPAMVAAVNRRAAAELLPAPARESEVVSAVLRLAGRLAFDPAQSSIHVDTTRFQDPDGRKLGLGSSAAVAVVAAALAGGRRDESVLRLALEAHREATGGGSGVDVAASFHGGLIATRRQPAPVERLSPSVPGLHLFVLFTGESADTATLVRACRASADWGSRCAALARVAAEGIDAWRRQEIDRFLDAVSRHGRGMEDLGRAAGVTVVTEVIDAVMRRAQEVGAAAKPSGAGGGDVVVGFSRDPELGQALGQALGLRAVELQIDPLGLSDSGPPAAS